MGAFAHELKTPMTSIIGFADLLRQGNLDENTRMMAAEYIYSEGRRLEKLSFKLLDLLLLKKDAITLRRVWLNQYIAEVDLLLRTIDVRKKQTELVRRRVKLDFANELDLQRALQQEYEAVAQLSTLERQIAISKNRMAILIGLSPSSLILNPVA